MILTLQVKLCSVLLIKIIQPLLKLKSKLSFLINFTVYIKKLMMLFLNGVKFPGKRLQMKFWKWLKLLKLSAEIAPNFQDNLSRNKLTKNSRLRSKIWLKLFLWLKLLLNHQFVIVIGIKSSKQQKLKFLTTVSHSLLPSYLVRLFFNIVKILRILLTHLINI